MKKDGLPDYAALMVVGVDAYQLGVPEGRLFNCYLESYIPFYGFMDLFLRIDQILTLEWKYLVPIGLVNLLLMVLVVVFKLHF